ncbi:MAG: HAD-superhydrolase, subIA, variant 3 family protein [Micavibrio sp.]|nr:HAD-superhydrolase, subIA, variant 3 family protein [Micavibrio sp.]
MQPFDAVFFDWDGTLVDSLDFVFGAHNHVRTRMGFEAWSREEFVVNVKYSSRQLYPRIYPGREEEAFDLLARFMDENHLKDIILIPGALELLETLHSAGIPMGVVSNKRDAFVKKEATHLGWDRFFKIVVGAGYAANDKPDAEPLVRALAEAGLRAGHNILFVGDTETDLLCAKNASCTAAFLYHDQPDNPLISQYNPDIIVRNCIDLKEKLIAPGNSHRVVI